jgi:hypothetical protein
LLPGYDPDVQKDRSEAREIMHKLGYRPDKRLALKVSTRNIAPYRVPILRNMLVRNSHRIPVNVRAPSFPATIQETRSHPSGAASIPSLTRSRLMLGWRK